MTIHADNVATRTSTLSDLGDRALSTTALE
jgi:hypothetical protein